MTLEAARRALAEYVDSLWILDTHEHLAAESKVVQEPHDFSWLFDNYVQAALISAGMAPAAVAEFASPGVSLERKWELVAPFLPFIRSLGYWRAPELVLQDLLHVPKLTRDTFYEVSARLRALNKPGWYAEVFRKSRIIRCVYDLWTTDVDWNLCSPVMRYDKYLRVASWREVETLCAARGLAPDSLEALEAALQQELERDLAAGIIGFKCGLAYERILAFDAVPKSEAEAVFARLKQHSDRPVDFAEAKPLQDYLMHYLLKLITPLGLPIQFHTGMLAGNGNFVTNSNPTHLTNLFFAYPDLRFVLLHAGYPYTGEAATLVKNFPNVCVDLVWVYGISPTAAYRVLHEYLEVLPLNKITAFGGDSHRIEPVYAYSRIARQIVAQVLAERTSSGLLSLQEAFDAAYALLVGNAASIYGLPAQPPGV